MVENLEAELRKQAGEAKKDDDDEMIPMNKKRTDTDKGETEDDQVREDDGNPIVANKEEVPEDTGEQQAESELQEMLFSLKNNPEVFKALLKSEESQV